MKISIFTVLLALFTTLSFGQESNTYKSTLKKMLQISGAESTYKVALNQMTSMFRQQQSNVPDEFWNELATEINKDALSRLLDLILPVYQKHLTHADLLQLIAFYESPVGKKFAEKSPLIVQESMIAGQEWGRQIGEKVVNKLKEKGYSKE